MQRAKSEDESFRDGINTPNVSIDDLMVLPPHAQSNSREKSLADFRLSLVVKSQGGR